MATEFIQLSGIAKWCKVRKGQLDPKYKNWSLQLYLDQESLETFLQSGLNLKFKEDEDGRYITLRRPESKQFGKDIVMFDPPGVWMDKKAFEGSVGNGSKITTKVEVFDTTKGKGHRLDGIRIDELVEYQGSGGGDRPKAMIPF